MQTVMTDPSHRVVFAPAVKKRRINEQSVVFNISKSDMTKMNEAKETEPIQTEAKANENHSTENSSRLSQGLFVEQENQSSLQSTKFCRLANFFFFLKSLRLVTEEVWTHYEATRPTENNRRQKRYLIELIQTMVRQCVERAYSSKDKALSRRFLQLLGMDWRANEAKEDATTADTNNKGRKDIGNLMPVLVHAFGSYELELDTNESDVDIAIGNDNVSVNAEPLAKHDELFLLQQVYEELIHFVEQRKQAAANVSLLVNMISTASVPIIQVKDTNVQLEMDVSIYRKQALIVELLQTYLKWNSSTNAAQQVYAFLCAVKHWSKVRHINDALNGKMNSFGIKYLQSLTDPVLPVLQVKAVPSTDDKHKAGSYRIQTSIHPLCPFAGYAQTRNDNNNNKTKDNDNDKNKNKNEENGSTSGHPETKNKQSLGEWLYGFFELWSSFPYEIYEIDIGCVGFNTKNCRDYLDSLTRPEQMTVCIKDPIRGDNNVAKNVRFSTAKHIFGECLRARLLLANNQSWLRHVCVGLNEDVQVLSKEECGYRFMHLSGHSQHLYFSPYLSGLQTHDNYVALAPLWAYQCGYGYNYTYEYDYPKHEHRQDRHRHHHHHSSSFGSLPNPVRQNHSHPKKHFGASGIIQIENAKFTAHSHQSHSSNAGNGNKPLTASRKRSFHHLEKDEHQ
ncbi:hypothetical protein RFI_10934 [Reticulomyxa filosa]|uniref:Poly(A) RNA polymerase mitochondrial-like central palm domain-containing protein n=1 Tax=Reticulomyxa filosa TaxID=46433 RepID=X6NKD7_RETFI|nr:hypothetical protein RFI_10934 [Reticulomyxa filosa]|eukprot:ETO26204.1 hypothetical protein RFI_10934 [Reticulomyxa filosa]